MRWGGLTILEKPGIYEMTSGHLILYIKLGFIKGVNLTHFIMGNLKGDQKSIQSSCINTNRALEPTGIREELVQSRLRSGSTDVGFAGQLEERRGKRSLQATEMIPLHP